MAGLPPARPYPDLLHAGLLVAFALRLVRLGAESFWYDELVSVYLARQPAADLIAHTAGDIHPPGYYLLLRLWGLIAGPLLDHGLEWLYAWLSVAAGMLVLALLYAVGRRTVGARAALIAVWLGAVNPFHVWYAQEVRMYTLGAALGLLCLWATLRFFEDGRARSLILYAVAAAAGLYTLYYFAFLLVALNGVALLLWWPRRARGRQRAKQRSAPRPVGRGRALLLWLGVQAAALLLYAPWLPTLWRQAGDPPVPPWRAPWENLADLLRAGSEAFGALVAGQSVPLGVAWPWALLALAIVAAFGLLAWRLPRGQGRRVQAGLLVYLLLPLLLIVAASLVATPLYHVRYLFTWAPVFLLMAGAVIAALFERRPAFGFAAGGLLALVAAFSLYAFWTDPAYAADDHRGAVAQLAAGWRPGDAILVNAGWVYPALEIYWPAGTPALNGSARLLDVARGDPALPTSSVASVEDAAPAAAYVRAGSVGGSPQEAASLGWGDPASDFFPMTEAETAAGLEALRRDFSRLWHYRLYDTVSDPGGVIRAWLDANTDMHIDVAIPGRDFLRLEARSLRRTPDPAAYTPDGAAFGEALLLEGHRAPARLDAGSTLYLDTLWQALPALPGLPTDLSASVRLYDANGQPVAQADAGFLPPTGTWTPGDRTRHVFALPVAATTPPGPYSLEIIVYRQDTIEPLPTPHGERWRLGEVELLTR